MPTRDCGDCDRLHCGNRFSDKDLGNLVARLICEIADNTAPGGAAASVDPWELLYDNNAGVRTTFLRIYDTTDLTSFNDVTLAGTAYVVTGTVEKFDNGYPQLLCDDNAGVITNFIRVYDPTTFAVLADYNLDGTLYTPTGTVGRCELTQERADVAAFNYADVDGTTLLTTYLLVLADVVGTGVAILQAINRTNEDLILSFSPPNDQIFIPAGASVSLDFVSNGVTATGGLQARAENAAPVSGDLIVTLVRRPIKT